MLYVANKLVQCALQLIVCDQCVRIVVGFFRVTLHYALYCTILHDIVRCTLYVVLQLKCVQPMCAYCCGILSCYIALHYIARHWTILYVARRKLHTVRCTAAQMCATNVCVVLWDWGNVWWRETAGHFPILTSTVWSQYLQKIHRKLCKIHQKSTQKHGDTYVLYVCMSRIAPIQKHLSLQKHSMSVAQQDHKQPTSGPLVD